EAHTGDTREQSRTGTARINERSLDLCVALDRTRQTLRPRRALRGRSGIECSARRRDEDKVVGVVVGVLREAAHELAHEAVLADGGDATGRRDGGAFGEQSCAGDAGEPGRIEAVCG